MSEGMNKVILLGNLGQDPELRFTNSGEPVAELRVATTERYKSGEEYKERTEWHTVTIWGKRGEALSKLLSKGSRVLIEGRIQTTTSGEGDAKKYYTKVVANDVFLCDGRREGGDREERRAEPPPQAASNGNAAPARKRLF